MWRVIGVLYCLVKLTTSVPVDNGVVGDPEVFCGDTAIGIDFLTRKPFGGHIFVIDRYTDPECRKDANATVTEISVTIPFSSCGVRRVRSVNPRGVFVSVTVVISFHPQFITKVDRAYMIQCFYMEAEKIVTTEIQVSMMTTQFQTQTVPMPICRYEVLRGGPSGPPVRYAQIGDQVYHKWTCDTETQNIFCMTVHTCKVDDGSGDIIPLLNDDGCALDKYLLGNLEYVTDLMAGKEAHVFKYADRPNLYFNCQISIAIKEPGGNCERPVCQEPVRGKRDASSQPESSSFPYLSGKDGQNSSVTSMSGRENSDADTVDVDSDPIMVLNFETSRKKNATNSLQKLDILDAELDLDQSADSDRNDNDICMNLAGFSAYTIFNLTLMVASIALFVASVRKSVKPVRMTSGY